MASIESGERQAPTQTADIWAGQDQGCGGKMTRRRVVAGGVVAACAVGALAIYFTFSQLSSGSASSNDQIVGQAIDSNSLGCFVDKRDPDRVLSDVLTDAESMTPSVCNDWCEGKGYDIYALQWGRECWCGMSDGVDLDQYGTGTCDYPCPGDEDLICGGYLAFLAYDVGVEASTPSTTSTSTCDGTVADISVSDDIVYFTGSGCVTLSDLYSSGGEGVLDVLDDSDNVVDGGSPTGRWLLKADVRIHDGVTLQVHGTSVGGDCDVLRIKSDGSNSFYEVRGHGGNLSFYKTKVTSWDTDAGEEQTTYEGGRSFINCVSEQMFDEDCDGAAKNDMGECRMDIIDSVMGNMGWFDGESYGLTWKVRGFCKDLSNPEVFERTQVYGDIQGSEIYGMYYGMYSYGHQGGVWTNNIMRDNILYGFDPHDDSDDLEIAYNTVYGNGNHGIIASKRCDGVSIHDNEVYDGGESAVGIFLHRSSDNAEVYNNYVHDMQDAGFALMESMDSKIYDNVVENTKYGIRLSLGSAGNSIYDNTFDGCSDAAFYTYEGSDEPWASDGRPSENTFEDNVIDNAALGVKIKQGDSNVFKNNAFNDAETFEFDETTDTTWTGNTYPSGACVDGDGDFTSDSDGLSEC